MRVFASLLAASALLLGAAAAEAAPRRVASLNLCTDELVLMLAAPAQIASVTHLSRQEAETPLWRQARAIQRNDGSLLSVVALRPDLVVTMGGGIRDRTDIAGRLGIPIARSGLRAEPGRRGREYPAPCRRAWPASGRDGPAPPADRAASAAARRSGSTRSGWAAAASPSPRPGWRRNGWRSRASGSGSCRATGSRSRP